MIIRALDNVGDWTFGRGLGNYKRGLEAIALNVETRLKSFLADCFFDQAAGIDWFNLLGSKNEIELRIAIMSTILNSEGISSVAELSFSLSPSRSFLIQYSAISVYGELKQSVEV